MKVAVTGASGFLGRHVLRALLERDVEVLAFSRRPPSLEPARGWSWTPLDNQDSQAPAVVMRGMPDLVVHLAWAGLPNYKSLHHFETELTVQYGFLSALVQRGLRRLVATGTCFEYGMQSGELHEGLPTDPRNPYGLAKDSLRRQLQLLREKHRFELTWARLFYMHGEGQPPSSLYSQWRAAHARGDAAFPMSGGDQLRDFLPVDRLSETLVRLAIDAPEAGVVNVCSGIPRSVRALVESWQAASGSDMVLELGRFPYPDYEPMAFWGSTAHLRNVLGDAAERP